MATTPNWELLAPGQKIQSASPQLDTAGAAVSPQQPQLAVVTLPDEIDTTNNGQVQDTLTRALDDGTAVLIADAGATTFCDCSGVTALLRAHHRAAAAGTQLRVAASPSVRRILELTGGDRVLDTYPTLAAALARGSRSPAKPLPADSALAGSPNCLGRTGPAVLAHPADG
jgi:anti-anti-sigma factor